MLPKSPYYHRRVVLLIFIFLLLRWITASVLELGNDEAYYWLYSLDLQWNYFDHPPMVAVWTKIFTLGGLLDNWEGMIRAGSVISCACSTWFLYKAVSLIKDERTGWFAACLFTASLYTGMIAGILIMPDSPQLFFWTFCLWQIAKLMRDDRSWITWLLFGISAGLCTMSKVHGVFLLSGLGLFILFKKREWLKLPQLYISFLLAAVIISPIFLWNLKYDFMTWQFHSARVNISKPVTEKDSFGLELLQQVIINNPFNMLLIVAALFLSSKKKLHPALTAYNFIALPLAVSLIFISFFRDIWYHWSGPAYTTLLPLAAVHLSEVSSRKLFPGLLKWSIGFFVCILLAWPATIHFYPGTRGSKNEMTLGKGDVTLDKYGWRKAGKYFAAYYLEEQEQGRSLSTPLICPTWWGAHVEYYFARPADAPVIGLGNTQAIHHYAWLNGDRVDKVSMDTAYCITPSIEADSLQWVKGYYRQQKLKMTIPVYRAGKHASNFYVYELTGWKGNEVLSSKF